MIELPPYIKRDLIAERLPIIFPEGTENRTYCTRELAASTIFSALYIGAVEGSGIYLGPVHVYRMTIEQSEKPHDDDRQAYNQNVLNKKKTISGVRWYADNTREPIRDETLRDGLVAIGAVIRREDLPTTSGAPKYALKADFAKLFNPALKDISLRTAIEEFQKKHLSKSALARVKIIQSGAVGKNTSVLVTFPSGETRPLAPGPSSIISRAVVEIFAFKFLKQPVVLWLSESGNKVVMRDDELANKIGLRIDAATNLPDLILCDLGADEPLIIFVEVVATDGAITARRQNAFYALTDAARFKRSQIAFVTAYQDRESAGYKKTVHQLAWNSFAWFVSEPNRIIIMRNGGQSPEPLIELINFCADTQ